MHFRVMTYNIHRAIGVDRRFRPERIIQILRNYDPDIALLQEVDEGVPRSKETDLGRDLARALGYPHVAVGHNVTLRKGRYGNTTLSRYPIVRERNIDLTVGRSKRRGCQHTAIRLDTPQGRSRRLEVFNLHLGLTARQRELQVGLLARSRELSSLPLDIACVVGGDFNDWLSQLAPRFTDWLKFKHSSEHSPSGERVIRTYPAFFPRGPLDRIYYRGPLRLVSAHRCRMRISKIASDHLPVIADFEMA